RCWPDAQTMVSKSVERDLNAVITGASLMHSGRVPNTTMTRLVICRSPMTPVESDRQRQARSLVSGYLELVAALVENDLGGRLVAHEVETSFLVDEENGAARSRAISHHGIDKF